MATKEAVQDNKFLEVKSGANGTLVFQMGNGQKLVFDPAKCNDEIRKQAMYHGFNQKIRDSAAGFSKSKDFGGAIEAMEAVIDALYDGAWKRAGGGIGTGVVMEDMATAIARIKKVPFEKALDVVKQATPERRAEWAKNARVAQYMSEAKAARLSAVESEDPDIEIPE